MDIHRKILFVSILATLFAVNLCTEGVSEDVLPEIESTALSPTDYLLPTNVYPDSYDILLIPDLEESFTFTGIVKINATVRQATNTITLHHGEIDIITFSVVGENENIYVNKTRYNEATEKYTLELNTTLKADARIVIAFTFSGVLNDKNIGFYRSSYFDEDGNLRYLAATQFQATYARHAFPCFDEPKFKASFTISIQRHKNFTCLSNMRLQKSMNIAKTDDIFWDTFEQSIPMSTYLVAFIISEFKSLGDDSFAVWSRPNAINQAQYAAEIGPRALKYLSNHFKQNYQLDKMDMVAVPDFASGAMENWGLVKYRETRMLYTENDSSIVAQQTVAAVIVHELTHMWFGNQVTPAWWSFLWLSEAFARYYQYFGTANIEPFMKSMEQMFVVEQQHTAFAVDALESSEPLSRNVYTQSEIGGMGDKITYSKGGSIIRMMNLIFGSEVFDEGIRNYLKDNKKTGLGYPEDLWFALQSEIEKRGIELRVQTAMDTWTVQPGYPVLSVSVNNGIATLKQSRFLLRNLESTPTNVTWWIPLTWTNGSFDLETLKTKLWFKDEMGVIDLDMSPDDFIIFNVQQSGLYRVNYDNATWYRIINVLNSDKFEQIHVLNRAGIVDDLLNLARAGQLDYATALDGLQYIKQEANYIPFKAAFNALEYLNRRFAGSEHNSLYQEHVLSLIEEIYGKLGYYDDENDDRLSAFLRINLNNWACKFEHEGCLLMSKAQFDKWMQNDIAAIHPNQRSAIYCTAIRHGTAEEWEFLWKQYQNSNSATEQTVILGALGCSTDKTILEKYLTFALTSYDQHKIRKQDSPGVFSSVYSSGLFGAEYILEYIETHYTDITRYGGIDMVASIISGASQYFSTEDLIEKLERFIETHSTEFEPILSSLKSSLELARYEYNWYSKNYESIVSWIITSNEKDDDETTTVNALTSNMVTDIPPVTEPTTPPDDDTSETTDYRLPTSVMPLHYYIVLTPHLEENFAFDGSVEISTQILESTDKIVLHSAEIEHKEIKVLVNGKEAEFTKNYLAKYEFLEIQLANEVAAGAEVVIKIKYTGILNQKMRGFYRSSYIDEDNNRRWLAATHLEPVGARKMFPCFDEPALKATFEIVVQVPKGYKAISNMPAKDVIAAPHDGSWYTFEKTPKMSTYLLALVVSDFKHLSDPSNLYSTWARPDAIHQTAYAQSLMQPFVKFYETILGHPYQIPKLDMVALPDFVSGAMENWGLLTYKESNLIYDENETAISVKQSIANVISHEIAHQWFGNLVSPLWWKYVWLSEGFARYFQYLGTLNVEATWSLESQFVVEQIHSAFGTDGLTSSHPMSHDVWTNSQISGIFDTISYGKSASILRMMEKTFGHKVFYDALSTYLEARQYDTATPEDLYEAFQTHVGDLNLPDSIRTIMDTWTTQAGYPVIHVSRSRMKIHLRQERFLLRNPKDEPIDQTWYVPITWTSEWEPNFENTAPKHWLTDEKLDITLDDTEAGNQWYMFNIQQAGFYRVNYEKSMWLRFIKYLKSEETFKNIHEVNRAALIDDMMNLARAGYLEYDLILDVMEYFVHETSYIPWRALFNALPYLQKRFQGRGIYDLFEIHLRNIMQPIFKNLTFYDKSTDDHTTLLLRKHLRQWSCEMRDFECLLPAIDTFLLWKKGDIQSIPPNYRSVVYCEIMKLPAYEAMGVLLELYITSKVAADKLVILKALGCSRDRRNLEQILELAIDGSSGLRTHDSTTIFTAIYDSGPLGVECVMDFIRNRYDAILDYYGDESNIKSFINGLSQRLSTVELYEKFIDFSEWIAEKEPKLEKPLVSYRDRALYELSWYNKTSPLMYEWLEKKYPRRNQRLPKLVSPVAYDISITPYMEDGNFTFDGKVHIDVELEKNTSRIALNVNELEIKDVKICGTIDEEQTCFPVSSHVIQPDIQQMTVYLKTLIPIRNVGIDIEYSGIISDDMQGFYRSSYHDADGRLHLLAATQFEPTHARRAFPCLDEPAYKASFSVNIKRQNNYMALSNMPIYKSYPVENENATWDVFNETVPMSSYLVAFVISDFTAVDSNPYKTFNVYGRPDVVPYGVYAEQGGLKILKYLEDYTLFDYPLPKTDLIGIPDFSAGAMENWGLATFREYGLFYDKQEASAGHANYIATIIAHELSHFWFGNLVTCEWWDYAWLNEGFAQYFEWVVSNEVYPTYQMLDQFVVYEMHAALQYDVGKRPMNNPVSTPAEISAAFDKIAYGKAASVLRMLHKSLGTMVFKFSVRDYLRKHAFGTANPTDLWQAVQKQADRFKSFGEWSVTVNELMSTWANQSGYPVVQAILNYDRMTLYQEPFTYEKYKPKNVHYWIPITTVSSLEPNFVTTRTKLWLGKEPMGIYVHPQNEWFLINVQQSGYYRVNYDERSWSRIIKVLNGDEFELIHALNRAQIIDDLLNLARGDYITYDFPLSATMYLVRETNHLPWKAFFNGIEYVAQRFEGREDSHLLREHILAVTHNIFGRLGFANNDYDNHLDELNRELILRWRCKYDSQDCVEAAVWLFASWKDDSKQKIPPNARPALYCTAIKNGTSDDWYFLRNEYMKTQLSSEKITILKALACSKNVTLLNEHLEEAFRLHKTSIIRVQDASTVFSAVCGAHEIGLSECTRFFMLHYKHISKMYNSWDKVTPLFNTVTSLISTDDQLTQLKLFLENHKNALSPIYDSLVKSLKAAEKNYQWYDDYHNTIVNWLNAKYLTNDNEDGAATHHGPHNVLIVVIALISCFLMHY